MRVEVNERLPPLRLEVLDVLRLVQNKIVPLLPPERERVLHRKLVTRDANVEGVELRPARPQLLPVLRAAVVRQNLEGRAKLLDLHLPVHEARRRHDDQVRAPNTLVGGEVSEHRNRLHASERVLTDDGAQRVNKGGARGAHTHREQRRRSEKNRCAYRTAVRSLVALRPVLASIPFFSPAQSCRGPSRRRGCR